MQEDRAPMPDASPSFADDRDSEHLAIFHQHRSLLFSIAYRMLGSSTDAEDMLQETFIRWQQSTDEKSIQPEPSW